MAVPSRPDIDVSGTMLEPPPGLDPDCLLFLGDPQKKTYTTFQRVWPASGLGVAFLFGSFFMHAAQKLPIRAAAHKHVYFALVGAAIGEVAWRFTNKYAAERDLQYYHYMILHPEDFQAPERKKWADVIQPWTPVR